MNKRRWYYTFSVLTVMMVAGCDTGDIEERTPTEATLASILGGEPDPRHRFALLPRPFVFPDDHGPHRGYRNEWWYFTGHLRANGGQRLGFQFTLFRSEIAPPAEEYQNASVFRTNEIWMGHAAVSDIDGLAGNGKPGFYHDQRLSRGGAGMAGDDGNKLFVGDWWLTVSPQQSDRWKLAARSDRFSMVLDLAAVRDVVLQGENGLSRKCESPGNASYYYSIPRFETSGELTLDGKHQSVTGTAWLDREWSTSALCDGQTGWDWFSLNLDDGADVMLYQLRLEDGSKDPYSGGSIATVNGERQILKASDYTLIPLEYWESTTGSHYPVKWEMQLKPLGRTLTVSALMEQQEMTDTLIRYWEGAVEARDASGAAAGYGYLEMTGY